MTSDAGADDRPNFEQIRQLNPYGAEYWSARELMGLLDYLNWRDFDRAIKRAILSCQQAGEIVADHFEGALKMVKLGSGSVRKVKDYNLSRLACYLVAQNGDPRKQAIAEAQRYFAISTRENELHRLSEAEAQRLMLHEQVTASNQDLAITAQAAGVNSASFGRFETAGYQGMYGGLDAEQLKTYKGISASEDLLDRMGKTELAAHFFRITQTDEKLRADQVQEAENAIATHRMVGQQVRQAIGEISGVMPEDLPAEPSLKPLLSPKPSAPETALPNPNPLESAKKPSKEA